MALHFGSVSTWRAGCFISAVIALAPRLGEAQAQPALPDLQARLVAMRFFASSGGVPNRAVRLYSTRFDAAAIRYLHVELEFELPPPGRVVEFPVTCQYLKPDGSVLGTIELKTQVQPNWPGVFRTDGWGNASRSIYSPGIYRSRCMSGSTFLGEASFEVVQPAPEIAAANGKFSGLRFFETPRPMLELKDRKYDVTFKAAETRSIGVELSFDAPPPGRVVEFPVECRILSPEGNEFGKFEIRYVMQPEWNGIINANVWGWEEAGKWTKGVYRTSCWSANRWIADGLFEIS